MAEYVVQAGEIESKELGPILITPGSKRGTLFRAGNYGIAPISTRRLPYLRPRIVQTANPTGCKWTVQLGENRTKTGTSYSRGSAIFSAVRTIDKAIKLPTKSGQ
jgi:hypothetical protein